jgi:hypothetical protein
VEKQVDMKSNKLEKDVARLATLILRDGDRFCGKPSQKRTSAIIESIESIGFNIGKHTFDHSDQVESRPEITVSEVMEWANTKTGKKYLIGIRKQIIQHQESEAKMEAEIKQEMFENEAEESFIDMETGQGF